ncbi:MAG: hypothetical protein RL653_110 [Pseudomonadota bacterium]|jgi:hypothetical protein
MFVDRLNISLGLAAGTSTASVPAGHLKVLSVRAVPYGFRVQATFWVVSQQSQSEDTLFSWFTGEDAITATLTIDRAFDSEGEEAGTLAFKGLVTAREVLEQEVADVSGQPVLQRRYGLEFEDRGAVLWRAHFPTRLYVDQSFTQLVTDNTPDGVTATVAEWSAAGTSRHIQALGLGADGNTASFYDYLHWALDMAGAGLVVDPAAGSYELRGKKKDGTLTATDVPRDDVERMEVRFPEVRRDAAKVLNSYVSASTKSKDVANADAATGVRKDHLVTSELESTLTDRATLETARLKSRQAHLHVVFARYPSVTLGLHNLYTLGGDWSSNLYASGKTWRLFALQLDARAVNAAASDDLDEETNSYELEVSAQLELQGDTVFHRPPYELPRWPFYVEGKVVSQVGTAPERTYDGTTDSSTSLQTYSVSLPVFDSKKVKVPYNPNLQPGHFYFPAPRDQRVLVALHHRAGFLKRFLDWHPGAQLPKDTQGEHLLLGKKAKNETSLKHVYTDSKPVFSITRTLESDTQKLEVSEGTLLLEVKEG